MVYGDMKLESETIEAPVPANLCIRIGESGSDVIGVPDAPSFDEARVQKHININGLASLEESDDFLLDDELKGLSSDSFSEAADDGSGVASHLPRYQAEPP